MDEIRRVAVGCIGRAVMFGSLAIGCVMVGFSFNPVSAFRSGAFLTLTMALALMWKAMTAAGKNPKHTEVWLYLDEKSRPADARRDGCSAPSCATFTNSTPRSRSAWRSGSSWCRSC